MYTGAPGTKFGLFALKNCSARFADPIELGDGVSAHPTCPIELPEHWRAWLGTLQSDVVVGANVLIAVEMTSETPTILDGETQLLDQRLSALWRGLLLQGVPSYSAGKMIFGGVDENGAITVKRVATPAIAYRHQFGQALTVDSESLRSAKQLEVAIRGIPGPGPEFRRLRAGFQAIVSGIERPRATERLHQFVRALDGLMVLPQGRSRTTFVQRGPTFVTAAHISDVLDHLYVLRNTDEHMNDFRTVIAAPSPEEMDAILSLRAYQSEHAALTSYKRLLSTPDVIEHFRTEVTIDRPSPEGEGFWVD